MSSTPQDVTAAIDPEVCWRVLERAASSVLLKRAARLREFLFYVGSKSLKEGRTDIHEQEIGQAVFGRPDAYDTSQDNIVRVSATELRKRIDAYFTSEGRDEPIVFDIPRGGYTPSFHLRAEAPPVPEPAAPAQVPAAITASAPASTRILLAFMSVAAVVLTVACALLWHQNQTLSQRADIWKHQPALSAFWSRFFASPQQTDVVVADTSFMLIEDLMKKSYTLNEYLSRSYSAPVEPLAGYTDPRLLASIASHDGGSFGDFRVAQRILALAPGAPNVSLNYARDYTAEDIKSNNVILIGSRRSNPWCELFTDQLNFDLEYDRDLNYTTVINRHPRPGEQAVYAPPANLNSSMGYSVIAYLPNPSHTAGALILEGTNSEATNAAGDFITSEQSMQSFINKLPGKKIAYFELLLRTSRVAGTPLNSEIVAYRTY